MFVHGFGFANVLREMDDLVDLELDFKVSVQVGWLREELASIWRA